MAGLRKRTSARNWDRRRRLQGRVGQRLQKSETDLDSTVMGIAAVLRIFSLANAADSTESRGKSRIRGDGKFGRGQLVAKPHGRPINASAFPRTSDNSAADTFPLKDARRATQSRLFT